MIFDRKVNGVYVIVGTHRDGKRGVRVFAVSRAVAHTVYDHAALLGRRGDHFAARTHTEGVNASTRRVRKIVVGRSEPTVARGVSVERLVDLSLQMLYANSDRKRFRLEVISVLTERKRGIPRAVTYSKHCATAGYVTLRGFRSQAAVLVLGKSVEPTVQYDLASERTYALDYIFNHRAYHVGPYVRFRFYQNIVRRAELYETLKRVVAKFVVYARGEFAVRKRSRASDTELDVALGVERTVFAKIVVRRRAVGNASASLDKNRFVTVLGKHKSAEHSGRSATYNKRSCGEFLFTFYGEVRLFIIKRLKAHAKQGVCFIFGHVPIGLGKHRRDYFYVVFVPCVDRFFSYIKTKLCGGCRTFRSICVKSERACQLFLRLGNKITVPGGVR